MTSQKVGNYFDDHVVNQFSKLRQVRRPVLTWLLLIGVLTVAVFMQTRQLRGFYIDEVPVSGGVLKEGMVGEVSNVNPLYTSNSADASLSQLIFSSLLKYNGEGEIEKDLVRKWSVNDSGTVYTFTLRDNAFWHDGQPVTADDVVFTFGMLQHPDVSSPLAQAWRGVKVKKENEMIVSFSLPNPFAPFLHNLINLGILPKHILDEVGPDQLRGHRFNLENPVGSGPFELIESVVAGVEGNTGSGIIRFKLIANEDYHFGEPKLDSIHLFTYSDREEMITDFNNGELALVGGLVASDIPESSVVEIVEEEVAEQSREAAEEDNSDRIRLESNTATVSAVPRTAQVMLFLHNQDDLLKNSNIRKAISYAIDRQAILELADSYYLSSRGPLLSSQLGYAEKYLQPSRDITMAGTLLREEGWKTNKDNGFRYKKGDKLKITIISQAEDILPEVLSIIQTSLKAVGIDVEAIIVGSDRIQQDFLAEHKYQALLYGVNVGHDPDQYSFWHSSQTGLNGRNLSGYSSAVADNALVAGRTRVVDELRIAKYVTFQARWLRDNPAVALYQPAYIYTYKKQVSGVGFNIISSAPDRYHNVQNWTVNVDQAEKPY